MPERLIDYIQAIEGGEKITAPGVYRMPIEWYHEDCCIGPSISSGGLRTIEMECPAEYWAFSYLNPAAYPSKDKGAFSFGRAAHHLLLGEDNFRQHFAIRPSKWKDWRTNDAKDWRDLQLAHGLTVITHEDMRKISGMARVMREHPLVTGTDLLEGLMEMSLVWEDRETGVWLKARPDVIPLWDGAITDYKTAANARPDDCRRSIARYGYAMQMALIAMGFEEVLGREVSHFLLVFQQVSEPYHVTPIEVSEDAIYWGRAQVRRAIRTFAQCLESGWWPSYTDEILVFDLPPDVRERLAREQEAGTLPNIGGSDAAAV